MPRHHQHFLWILFFCLFQKTVIAQNTADSSYIDHSYIRHINDKVSISTYFSNSKLNLLFNNYPPKTWFDDNGIVRRERPKDILYTPNNSYLIGLGFAFGNLGVRASIQTPYSQYDEGVYGKSSVFRLRADGFIKKWYLDAEYYRYSGFIDSSIRVYDSLQTEPSPLIRDDIITRSINLHAVRFTNNRFSYKAVFKQKKIQLRSAFTTYYKIRYRSENYSGLTPFLPPLARNPESQYGSMTKLRMNDLTVIGGVAGVLVYKGFYIGTMLGVGVGGQHQGFTLDSGSDTQFSFLPALDFKASAGYNHERLFITLQTNTEVTYSALPHALDQEFLAISYFTSFEVNCGYRFNMGPKLNKTVKWVNDLINQTAHMIFTGGKKSTK
ncbi:DUF4421 domain-containing protein [Flammeovirga yaeyamensis]|uniref:DUF4421 domain-containing protein n=1 Tax=Flammeovirga yaeyamensis TaxID=367791 RepID=A0AAX1N5C5_9BACT|nr:MULTISPECIES: DUF4421 family protein [Flammeovirga]ANQ49798.1 DUF4421 domain-containing protein [Flammeovirga sp. MY04]MBB3697340.1 hypothetical protein [Flammeovirga yaeyamensis]NMF36034.1 DUF4421 domain-containing protein [Flammeovirga yaeyamensis]QWG02769.1 DUF4421 domain-containing protein [Flammeovirga yaeyamensis]